MADKPALVSLAENYIKTTKMEIMSSLFRPDPLADGIQWRWENRINIMKNSVCETLYRIKYSRKNMN